MDLPKINSLREKTIKISDKKIKLRVWSNLQLTKLESIIEDNDYNIETIFDSLLVENVECDSKLTLQEKRYVLVELYKISRGNLLDIEYTCSNCSSTNQYSIELDKCVEFTELKDYIIKTTNCTFNLKKNSNYCIDITKDIHSESMKYICSFISSIEYDGNSFEVPKLVDLVSWMNTELQFVDFEEFIEKSNKIMPSMKSQFQTTCLHCGKENIVKFKIEDFLV